MRSGFIALIFAFGLSAAASAAELQPKSIAFLIELGFDPKSPKITDIVNDQVGERNLDNMAAERDKDGVKRFIATRNFVRQYRKNTKTPFPSREFYETRYLTAEEVTFVSAEILRQECAAEKASPQTKPAIRLRPCPN